MFSRAGKTWICTLRNETLRRVIAYNNEVTVEANAYYLKVMFANNMYWVGWDWDELVDLAYNAKYSPNGAESLDNVALNHEGISETIRVFWKPRMPYGGYEKSQASNTALRLLARQYKNPEMIKSALDTMSTQSASAALKDLISRPAAQLSIAWTIIAGLVRCFGGDIQRFLRPGSWLVGPEESGESDE